MIAARAVLLVAAIAGAVLRPRRLPAFVLPVVCAGVEVASGLIGWHLAASSLRLLASPLGFLLAAIPLSVLLGRLGYFEQLAGLFGDGRLLVPGLWLLGAGTVAVLNLDAAVVLLTPLYLEVAARSGRSRRHLGFEPVILALLASSFLPVSNLTNLIAAARLGVGPVGLLEHLGLPAAAACAVGYLCYRGAGRLADPAPAGTRAVPVAVGADLSARAAPTAPAAGAISLRPADREPRRALPEPAEGAVAFDRRVLVVGSIVVGAVLLGFVLGPSVGIAEWEVALGADAVLVAVTKTLPVRSIPWATALVAAGLAVLAAGVVQGVDLSVLYSGSGPLAELRQAAVAAVGANVLNNLPTLLVSLPFVSSPGGHATCALWPVLYGLNAGPGLLITGSLASLLWFDTMHRLGSTVTAGQYLRMGARVVMPAAAAGLAVLVLFAPVVGCG